MVINSLGFPEKTSTSKPSFSEWQYDDEDYCTEFGKTNQTAGEEIKEPFSKLQEDYDEYDRRGEHCTGFDGYYGEDVLESEDYNPLMNPEDE